MNRITRKTNLGELTFNFPELAQTLIEDYGLHCLGCYGAEFENLEEGSRVHGMTEQEITQMVKCLNLKVKDGFKHKNNSPKK
jgi:hybrid cluster-associated redox disulfide protein